MPDKYFRQYSEEILDTIWHTSDKGYALVSEQGRFLKANDAFCDIVEYTENQLKEKSFQDITHPEDIDYDNELAKEVVLGLRRTYEMKKRYITKTGKIVWVKLKVNPFKDGNHFKFFISQISCVINIEMPKIIRNQTYDSSISFGFKLGYLIRKYWVQIVGVISGIWIALKHLPDLIKTWQG